MGISKCQEHECICSPIIMAGAPLLKSQNIMKHFEGVIVVFITIRPLNFAKNVISDCHTLKTDMYSESRLWKGIFRKEEEGKKEGTGILDGCRLETRRNGTHT